MQNEVNNIVLLDEEGNEVEFDVVTKLDIEDKEYLIVVPSDGEEEDAVALKVVIDEDGNEALASVDDEEEFLMVSEAYELLALEDIN
ncbi:DUF1292 domain-containing protein [Clostridium fallax]|uniref:UPF0473 protein SAMN05443638_11647 n=1 Tax=Clostridium fallax TaxID=1533 RepID=A0A1M4X825_9CLOT|nr:DUF1292 domain-containing protein [Clostridium fallax]SHE89573.1 Protein of unknown function [Clostridium fallax]SQB07352.1 Uncharacterized protein conserved in bacteria [Clostridium fallax]